MRPYDRSDVVGSRSGQVERRTAAEEIQRLRRRRELARARSDSIADANRRRSAERREAEERAWQARVTELADRNGWSPDMRNLVLARQVAVGMDETMVRAAWGWPEDVNRTTTARGTREQWVYGDIGSRRYVYFEDGVVTAIQK